MEGSATVVPVADRTEPLEPLDGAVTSASPLAVGVVVWLASEVMFFAGLFAAYFVLRSENDPWPPAGAHLDVAQAALSTVLLVTSSFTMHLAVRGAEQGRRDVAVRWLLVMAVFVGLLVLIGRDVTGRQVESTRRGRTVIRMAPGRVDGVLIDLRNKVSLSRLQLVLWTVVVLSAWVTLALHRTIPIVQGRLVASAVPPAGKPLTILTCSSPWARATSGDSAPMAASAPAD